MKAELSFDKPSDSVWWWRFGRFALGFGYCGVTRMVAASRAAFEAERPKRRQLVALLYAGPLGESLRFQRASILADVTEDEAEQRILEGVAFPPNYVYNVMVVDIPEDILVTG